MLLSFGECLFVCFCRWRAYRGRRLVCHRPRGNCVRYPVRMLVPPPCVPSRFHTILFPFAGTLYRLLRFYRPRRCRARLQSCVWVLTPSLEWSSAISKAGCIGIVISGSPFTSLDVIVIERRQFRRRKGLLPPTRRSDSAARPEELRSALQQLGLCASC